MLMLARTFVVEVVSCFIFPLHHVLGVPLFCGRRLLPLFLLVPRSLRVSTCVHLVTATTHRFDNTNVQVRFSNPNLAGAPFRHCHFFLFYSPFPLFFFPFPNSTSFSLLFSPTFPVCTCKRPSSFAS